MLDLYRGSQVRLGAESADVLAQADVAWQVDSEFHRLADSDPARLWSFARRKQRREELVASAPDEAYFYFSVRALASDRLIGVTMLRVDWPNADAIFGIAIGDREHWGRGFGTEATGLTLRFAFLELNLRRVTLGVDAFNARAIRSYEKSGFRIEGSTRGDVLREGKRYSSLSMGILREEWQAAGACLMNNILVGRLVRLSAIEPGGRDASRRHQVAILSTCGLPTATRFVYSPPPRSKTSRKKAWNAIRLHVIRSQCASFPTISWSVSSTSSF
jgi:RimJ/RimL family protein N-acetyltransferase